jgi:hypothetical protein
MKINNHYVIIKKIVCIDILIRWFSPLCNVFQVYLISRLPTFTNRRYLERSAENEPFKLQFAVQTQGYVH